MQMKKQIITIFLIGFQIFFVTCAKKNDDQNKISNSDGSPRKFRSGRVNQAWEKAVKMKLSPVVMTDLHADLEHLDQRMMEHKRTKAKMDSDDGSKDFELTEQLFGIMEKYGMVRKPKPVSTRGSEQKLGNRFLEDPKLDKLWQTANKHGKFSEEELKALEMEFHHHRRKIQEYEILRTEVSKADELSDNSVQKQLNSEETKSKKAKMVELQNEIGEGIERLQLKTKQGTLSADAVPFTEPRVAQLWEDAKKGNFSDEELESIKEELHHFQTRIEKHLFFRDQLKNSVEKMNYHGGEDSAPQQHKDTHNHLRNKVQDLATKVKKLHHELSQKLSSGSTEHREL